MLNKSSKTPSFEYRIFTHSTPFFTHNTRKINFSFNCKKLFRAICFCGLILLPLEWLLSESKGIFPSSQQSRNKIPKSFSSRLFLGFNLSSRIQRDKKCFLMLEEMNIVAFGLEFGVHSIVCYFKMQRNTR